jgi:hypothetical protein
VDDIKALFELAGCYEDYERITSLEEFAWNKGNPIQFGRRNIVYYDYVNDNIEVSSQCTDRFRQTAELLGFEIIGTESKEIKMEECIITEKDNCPHEIISGKICSSCKVPDTKLEMVIADEGMCSLCGQKEVEEIHITTLNGRGESEPMGVCKTCWQNYTNTK